MAAHDHITYAIASCMELMQLSIKQKQELLGCIHQSACSRARRSKDNSKVIIKWTTSEGNPLTSLGITHDTYTYDEITNEIKKEEWCPDEI